MSKDSDKVDEVLTRMFIAAEAITGGGKYNQDSIPVLVKETRKELGI
jgi:hypothetical protein